MPTTLRRFRRPAAALLTALLLATGSLTAHASDVDVTSVVDVTAPTGSVELAPGGSGAITINMRVTGKQEGTATFEVYRQWELSGGTFTGSNPQEFTVSAQSGGTTTNFTTTGSVAVAAGQSAGTYSLQVAAFGITNSNNTGAKLDAGTTATYSVTVTAPTNTAPTINVDDVRLEGNTFGGRTLVFSDIGTASDAEDAPALPTVTCSPVMGSVLPLGANTVTCTATDSKGLTKSDSGVITVEDTKPPVISETPGSQTVEATSSSGALATYTSPTASDIVSGAVSVSCVPTSGSTFAVGSTTVICSATDASGNSASDSFAVNVQDTTAPTAPQPADLTNEATSAAGAAVSFDAPAFTDLVDSQLTTTCTPTSGSTFPLGNTTVTCTATDAANNTGSTSFVVTVEDTTAPELTVPTGSAAEATGPNGADVTFDVSAADQVDADPTVSCTPASGSTFALGKTTVNCTAKDDYNNTSSKSFIVTVEDTTDPVIAWVSTKPEANNGWNNSAVTVTWTCSDVVGVEASSVAVTLTGEGENQSATGTCEDTSGNTASDTQNGINIDLTAPGITWNGGPADGGSYYFGSVPAAPTCDANDALSGLDGLCTVEGYGTTVGSHSVKATATDKAGNTTTETRTYNVLAWTVSGFYQPVDMNGTWNTVKGGSTVPLKFEVFAGPTELTDTGAVASFIATKVSCTNAAEDAIESLATSGGTSLRYDTTGGQFIQNWQTPKAAGTCYKVTMTTQDGQSRIANFKLK